MRTKVEAVTPRMSKKEFLAESDRLLREAQSFLNEARRNSESSRRVGAQTDQLLKELEQRLLCGKN